MSGMVGSPVAFMAEKMSEMLGLGSGYEIRDI